jgi:hypothetical protein
MVDLTTVPEAIHHPVSMDATNSVINLLEGNFLLETKELTYQISGNISYKWFPQPGLILKAVYDELPEDYQNVYEIGEELRLKVNGNFFGDCVVKQLSQSSEGVMSVIGGFRNAPGFGDKTVPVTSVRFAVANLKSLNGTGWIKYKGEKRSSGRATLESDEYVINLDPIPDFKASSNSLHELGGYAITYHGELTKKKGSLTYEESHDVLDCLRVYLSFLNGRRCAPLFREGMFEGKVTWQDYGNYITDAYKSCFSFKPYNTNDLCGQGWTKFFQLWKDEDDRDFLTSMIHWYVESNGHSAFTEGSIIMAQAALELAYNWLIIEKERYMTGNDAQNISASNKLRLLLSHLKVKPNFPTKLTYLTKLEGKLQDCPDAITVVRNAIIHSHEQKRKDLRKIEDVAKAQALYVAIWYIELVMLKVLEYDGFYRNRVANNPSELELVPWSDMNNQDASRVNS